MTYTPYNHTQTSRDRARYLDESGTGAERRQDILGALRAAGTRGMTSKEYAESRGFDSLPTWVTGAFTAIHADGDIARIDERRPEGRGSAYVYVDLRHVFSREEVPYRSNKGISTADRDAFRWAVDQIAAAKAAGKSLSAEWDDLSDRLKGLL